MNKSCEKTIDTAPHERVASVAMTSPLRRTLSAIYFALWRRRGRWLRKE